MAAKHRNISEFNGTHDDYIEHLDQANDVTEAGKK
jgi:hypothetical protein